MITASTTPVPTAQNIFQTLGQQLLADASGFVKASLTNFANNVQANPTTQNVVAQGLQLQVQLLLSGPTLEQEGISQAAAALKSLVALLPSS